MIPASRVARRRIGPAVALAAILVGSFALRMAFVHEPFERDEGFYATVAQQILRGALPYRDVIDVKQPGVYYVYAFILAAFGHSVEAVRIFTALYASLTLLLVYAVSRRLFGVRAGLLSALLFGIFSTAPRMQASSSNVEVFMLLPVLAAFWFVLRYGELGRWRDIFLAGVCGGLALTLKTVALPQLLVCAGVLPWCRPEHDEVPRRYARVAIFAAGGAAVVAGVCSFFALHGAWREFYLWNVSFVWKYGDWAGFPLGATLAWLSPELVFPSMLVLAGMVRLWTAHRGDPGRLGAALLVPASIVGALLPGKNFAHYFIQIVPSMALVGGFALDELLSARRAVVAVAGATLLVAFAYFAAVNLPYYATYSPQQVSTLKYGPVFVDAAAVAQHVRERTRPDDYIFQWGLDPEIYFLAARRPAGPYLANYLIDFDEDPRHAVQAMLAALTSRAPTYIVVGPDSESTGWDEVRSILREHYALEAQRGDFYVFRILDARREASRPTGGGG